MSGKLAVMPVNDVRAVLLQMLIEEKVRKDPFMLQLAISLTEYMKDVERWHHVRDNQGGIPEFDSAQAVTDYVDQARGGK